MPFGSTGIGGVGGGSMAGSDQATDSYGVNAGNSWGPGDVESWSDSYGFDLDLNTDNNIGSGVMAGDGSAYDANVNAIAEAYGLNSSPTATGIESMAGNDAHTNVTVTMAEDIENVRQREEAKSYFDADTWDNLAAEVQQSLMNQMPSSAALHSAYQDTNVAGVDSEFDKGLYGLLADSLDPMNVQMSQADFDHVLANIDDFTELAANIADTAIVNNKNQELPTAEEVHTQTRQALLGLMDEDVSQEVLEAGALNGVLPTEVFRDADWSAWNALKAAFTLASIPFLGFTPLTALALPKNVVNLIPGEKTSHLRAMFNSASAFGNPINTLGNALAYGGVEVPAEGLGMLSQVGGLAIAGSKYGVPGSAKIDIPASGGGSDVAYSGDVTTTTENNRTTTSNALNVTDADEAALKQIAQAQSLIVNFGLGDVSLPGDVDDITDKFNVDSYIDAMLAY